MAFKMKGPSLLKMMSVLKQTDKEKRLLEIKRQRALLNKEEEFKEEKKTKPTVGTLKIKDGEIIGGGPDGGAGDLYNMMRKVITLDFGDQDPVNK